MPYRKNMPRCECGHSRSKHKAWWGGWPHYMRKGWTKCLCNNCECKWFKMKIPDDKEVD